LREAWRRGRLGAVLRREPYRLLFPLGALLAWAGVLPWLFFALRVRQVYEPVNGLLAYRSFLHPCRAGRVPRVLRCRSGADRAAACPAAWQVAVAAVAPVFSAVCAALGHWQLGQAASLALLA